MTLEEKIRAFLTVGYGSGYGYGCASGSGSGDGDGYGYGCGYGDGYGSGDGYGDGCASGCGSGCGDGYGSGSGSGDGDGDGSGYDYGDGYGSGDGYGITSFDGRPVHRIDGITTILRSVCGNVAHGAILRLDLTTEECYVARQGGFFSHGRTLAKAMEALREKLFENMPEDERIAAFLVETEDEKRYPAQHFYDWHHRLTGSCDMGRQQFARDNGIDVDNCTMTLREFLELTKDAYGGDVIRRVMNEVEKEGEG